MKFQSIAERNAAATFANMQVPVLPCQSFTDAGLSTAYTDSSGVSLTGKPDFVARQPFTVTTIESKDGKLNYHLTQESSRAALQSEHERYTRRVSCELLSHSFLSDYFWKTPARRACLDHGWNHSLWKVLALQAEHGWQRYVVVFKNNPAKADAVRYLEAGLVFCTQKTLPDLLQIIELAQHGIFVPFVHEAKRAKYGFTVTADHTDLGKPAAVVAAADRAKFLAAATTASDTTIHPF
jgi:hypothetical protein